MLITFSSSPSQQPVIELNYPQEFLTIGPLNQRKSITVAPWGAIEIRERWFEGVCVFLSDFKVNEQARLHLHCDSFCWLMNFMIEGELTTDMTNEHLHLMQNHYQTFYCQALDTDLVLKQDAKVFTICLTRRYISKLLGKDLLSAGFESRDVEKIMMVVSDDYRQPRMYKTVMELMEADQPDYINRIYLEGKILELLSLQLEALNKKQSVPENLANDDVQRLYQAKSLIEENIKTPCSLIELARKTGLNDFKLKKGFKSLFGTTVFGYLADLRMETAYQLLQKGTSITAVAEQVGYKNAHHFTAAFKKKYHILPSKIIA